MNKPKILLVENSTIVLQIEKRCLKNEAVAIFTAADAEEALSAARKILPDMVYLAFSLPGMDGAACCRAMKSDPELAKIPVVMVSNATEEEIGLCRTSGCDAHITKPLDQREFLEVGRSLLARERRREERVPCRATVACSLAGKTFYGTIEDVSVKGMFVGTSCEVAPGDILAMKFILPWSGASLIETAARVAWLNSGKPRHHRRQPVGFGVVFHELGRNAEDLIKDYMEFTRMRLSS